MSNIRLAIPSEPLLSRRAAAPDRALWRNTLERWIGQLRERDQMQRLTDRERRDAGISAYDVAYESRTPFWRL